MIIRALRLRHGRLALPKPSNPLRASRRFYSLETESTERTEKPDFVDPGSIAQRQLDSIPNVRSVHINDPNDPVAQDYAFRQHQKATIGHLGATIAPHYKPHELLSNPPSPKDITLELLLASQAHIGHSTSLWHPANARYIFGVRGRKIDGESPIHIISLETTAAHLRRACKIVNGVTERGGLVLFVGTREGQARAVVRAASLAKGCHLFTRWIPGSITNGQQILGKCEKKVVNEFDQEVPGFEDQLGVKAAVKPDLVVCLNPVENYVLLHECGLNNIPTIGIVDTDCNPTWVTYPIPANDDSLRCVQVIAGVLGRAGQEGQKRRLELAKQQIVTYPAIHGLEPPKKLRRSRAKPQQRQPSALPAEDLDLPNELEGVEVKQHLEDQRILDQAEKVLQEKSGASLSEQDGEQAVAMEEAEEKLLLAEDELEEDDVYSSSASETLDQSLTNENYKEHDLSDEDLAQFGGVDQLYHQSSSSVPESEPDTQAPESVSEGESGSTLDQVSDVAKELGEDQSASTTPSSSTLDQVSDVAKELGEEQQPAPEADFPVEEGDAAKEEAPVTDDGAAPSEATTESVEKEEDGKDEKK
ncbi:hypothetical protein M409DRAFT_64251 [Zasmidium cellare ATCC 36951]|uniref:Ribosomal protein S2 n=1 Tax=Zasmidium cellare ATCC 36951 TaxID=1080233 RepID=A0A6A6CTH2_ZASCE|nr:uncharacterized protein M409DRAFT_64251 [Zasmidium cellare ATCC 36951]KAF2170557.1 hypothetical protein M409DRAFT_64251 [Zasmidium cellare ATCC 36951]